MRRLASRNPPDGKGLLRKLRVHHVIAANAEPANAFAQTGDGLRLASGTADPICSSSPIGVEDHFPAVGRPGNAPWSGVVLRRQLSGLSAAPRLDPDVVVALHGGRTGPEERDEPAVRRDRWIEVTEGVVRRSGEGPFLQSGQRKLDDTRPLSRIISA